MSFALTTPQMLEGTKTVTRRLGWASLWPGTLIQAVEKAQGLRKGEKVRRLGVIRVVSVRRERLDVLLDRSCAVAMRDARVEVRLEGFPHLSPEQFVAMFCEHNGCTPAATVTRIEFEHVSMREAGDD